MLDKAESVKRYLLGGVIPTDFRGVRTPEGILVTFYTEDTDGDLPPRNDMRNHSPDGFNWGYGGSGPAQLALAICCFLFPDCPWFAKRIYQDFKRKVICRLPHDHWLLGSEEIVQWIERNVSLDKFEPEPLEEEWDESQTGYHD